MPAPEEHTAAIRKHLESLVASLKTNVPAAPTKPPVRPSKSVALTLRLDPARYARLSAYAAQYTPRRSFQVILVAALDAYLNELEGEMASWDTTHLTRRSMAPTTSRCPPL